MFIVYTKLDWWALRSLKITHQWFLDYPVDYHYFWILFWISFLDPGFGHRFSPGVHCHVSPIEKVTQRFFSPDPPSPLRKLQKLLDRPKPPSPLKKFLSNFFNGWHVPEPACLSLPPTIYSDGHGTVQSVNGSKQVQCKRRQQDVAALREALEVGDVASVLHLAGPKNPVDPLTKLLPLGSASTSSTVQVLEQMLQGQAPPKA